MPKNTQVTDGQFANAFDKANAIAYREKHGLGASLRQSQDVQERIEKMFQLIEEKTSSMTT